MTKMNDKMYLNVREIKILESDQTQTLVNEKRVIMCLMLLEFS